MAIKGRTPERGARGLTFTHDKCRGEKARHGWLSGDVHVLESHVGEGKSKPCERILLHKNAECPGCAAKKAIEPLGYVPLRDQTGKPVCVVVRKERIAFVGNMQLGTPVTYGRDEGRFEGVFVVPRLVEAKWEKFFNHAANDDMSYWLPQFLGVPHLASAMFALFHAEQCQPTVTEPLPAPVEVAAKPAPAVPARVKGRGLSTLEVTVDDIESDIQRKLKSWGASPNGKHKVE
jgi:hypothetical protein